jgi:histidine triad (HIT) family protein
LSLPLSHQPPDYQCPFCAVAAGRELPGAYTQPADVVYRDAEVTAFIAAAWWPNNRGHVIVIPNQHCENVYDIPDALLAAVQLAGKRVALALRAAYSCDGTSFRQHNEPGGYQDVWHYHLHVFPRYLGDNLYGSARRWTTPEERRPYAERLRPLLDDDGDVEAVAKAADP